MPPKTALNAKNLEALGAERLAALLLEISAGNAAAKRRLRLELAGEESPAEAARAIAKRLAAIARSRTYVDWQNRKGLVEDLESQRRAIAETVAKADAGLALELIWRFAALADPVFARCDDSSGTISAIFHQAVADLGAIALAAKPDAMGLADQAFAALLGNGYGQYDGLIAALSPALGAAGLERLKQRMIAHGAEKREKPAPKERRMIGYGSGGPVYQDEIEERSRGSAVRQALMDIADAEGDADAYIAQYDAKTRQVPRIAAEVSRRLLKAGRIEDAWRAIEAAEHPKRRNDLDDLGWHDFDWDDARIDVLEAMGRKGEAQAARWSCFELFLSAPHLSAYLKGLPDFEDTEAERRALDLVALHGDPHRALWFLVSWPALGRAASLIEQRASALDGNRYEILTPAAEVLAARHPLAASLALRALINFTLTKTRASRYKHAARHLAECESLAAAILSFGSHETHGAYLERLRRDHDRKSGFWGLVR